MESPKLTGFRNDNRPYEVTASAATQDVRKPNLVELKDLRARIVTDDKGGVAQLEAAIGVLNTEKEQMNLRQDVRVAHRFRPGGQAPLRLRRLQGRHRRRRTSPSPFSSATASSMPRASTSSDNGKVMHFRGRVRTVFDSRRRQPAATRYLHPRRQSPSAPRPTDKSPSMMSFDTRALARARSSPCRPAGAALAQPTSKERAAGFGNFGSSKEPIKIDADKLDVYDKEGRAVFAGNVVAVQGDSTMNCTLMTVFYEQKRDASPGAAGAAPVALGSDDSAIKKIDCKGPVTIVSQDAGRDRRRRHLRPRSPTRSS